MTARPGGAGSVARGRSLADDLHEDPPARDPRELLPAWLGKVAAEGEAGAPATGAGGALRDIRELFPVPVAWSEKPKAGFLANYPPRRTGSGADRGPTGFDAYFAMGAS